MGHLKFSAKRVFDGKNFLPEGTVVIVGAEGSITDLVPAAEAGEGVKMLEGILLPGLINAHCHLELSHFKGLIEPGGGLVKFLLSVVRKRKEPRDMDKVYGCIDAAMAEMEANGIVGVGDICNTTDALAAKKSSRLLWHNLVEVLNFTDETLAPRLEHNRLVLAAYLAEGQCNSVLTPHAPYSVSPATFNALNEASVGKVISVHNQETEAEDELFIRGGGDFSQLYELTGTPPLGPTRRSSLQSWLPYFTKGQTVVLVHNTYTRAEDIAFAKAHAAQYGLKLVFCLCPAANLYIEEKLPPLDLFAGNGCTLLLGTDSYSSNHQLSIAAEMKLLADHYPQVALETLLQAATQNGADAFGWNHLGRLKKGVQPGLTLLHTQPDGSLAGTSEKVL